jgi:hypothetical protein
MGREKLIELAKAYEMNNAIKVETAHRIITSIVQKRKRLSC